MSAAFDLIVTDTSPLFTLVLADALDALLRPGLPVSIPDAVYIEATRVRGTPGADRIVEWLNDHLDRVRIVPTDIGIDQQRRLEEGRGVRGLGEQAAIETLDRHLRTSTPAPCCCSRIATSTAGGRSWMSGSAWSAPAISCVNSSRRG